MKYKGIELEGLDKKVKLSHSRVMETDEGTDWIDKLLTCDKAALTPTQFHEVSALSSVINMDYQICNGGIGQYVTNGYHEYRAGCEVHVLTSTGIVLVFNAHSCKLVTVLVARPGQVARYYEPFGEDVPDWLMARAYENTCVRHLNY